MNITSGSPFLPAHINQTVAKIIAAQQQQTVISDVFVPAASVEQATNLIRTKQNNAVLGGWQQGNGTPLLRAAIIDGGCTRITFESPMSDVEEIKQDLKLINELIEVVKELGSGVESLAKTLGNAAEGAATAVVNAAKSIFG